ncbi:MAG: AAA family ATPase [Chloroflexi bacterium]|nr:AAA family ATPase [Chloroflexota bacterium]
MTWSLKSVTRSAKVASHASQLHLYALGPLEVRLGEKLLTFPTRKTAALLIYLALEGGEQPREHLAALLWPEAKPERSYASLRNTLGHLQSALRQASGQAQTNYLSVTHNALGLNPDADIHLDLHTVERAYTQARADRSSRTLPEGSASLLLLQSSAACYRGDFLAGFSLGDAPGFDDWAAVQREAWRRRLGLILDRLSEIQFARGELASTAETASLWIALDGLNEVAYRRKMRAHFAAGERGQALETYDACRAVLAAELSIEPGPDTEALAARIRTQHPLSHSVSQLDRLDTPVAFLESLFAGRAAEYQVLVERYGYAATGQPQVVTLRGEAGIGKTRLAEEFLTWAVAQGAETLHGRAFESGSRMSYQTLIEAFRPRLERDNALKDWLGEAWLAPLSQLFPELRDRYPELPLAQLKAPADRTQLFESLVRLTLALANPPLLVLFVDDMQWADSATLDLLQYAVRRWRESAARILLLVSLRSETLPPSARPERPSLLAWLAQVERELGLYHLALEPLSERDTVQMVLSMLAPPAADFAQWVFNETRGQPFYLMETLKDLLERGALHPKRQADGKWAFEVDAEHDLGHAVRVPSTVRAVIRSRLNRLSPKAFTLLAAGATLEHRLTFERLCAIANVAEDMGLAALDELVSGQLLLEVAQPGDASAYVFAHQMIWDVVYTEAGDARRRLFHRRALDVLEAAREPAAVLAYHALAAGLAEAAFRYSLAAGQEALRLSAAGEAVVHFEKARQLAQEASLAGVAVEAHLRDLYLQLGWAYELNGQPEQALAVKEHTAHAKTG